MVFLQRKFHAINDFLIFSKVIFTVSSIKIPIDSTSQNLFIDKFSSFMGWAWIWQTWTMLFAKVKFYSSLVFFAAVPFKTHPNLLLIAIIMLLFPFNVFPVKNSNSTLKQLADQYHSVHQCQQKQFLADFQTPFVRF